MNSMSIFLGSFFFESNCLGRPLSWQERHSPRTAGAEVAAAHLCRISLSALTLPLPGCAS